MFKVSITGFRSLALAACFLIPLLTGCNDGEPDLVQVSGQVVQGDKPVPDASIEFIPDSMQGRRSTAWTDSEGKFELMFKPGVPGVLPGAHRVVIITGITPPQPAPEEGGPTTELTEGTPAAGPTGPGKQVTLEETVTVTEDTTDLTLTLPEAD